MSWTHNSDECENDDNTNECDECGACQCEYQHVLGCSYYAY